MLSPPSLAPAKRSRARFLSRRLLTGAFVVSLGVWNVSLVAAPYALRHRDAPDTARVASLGVYWIGHTVCHQRPERSFHLFGAPLPVCARCHGLYAAALVGAFCALVMTPDASRLRGFAIRPALLWTAVPLAGSVALEWAGFVMSPGWARAVSAAPFGAMVAVVVGAAIRGLLR